jgi:hypothetical protein
MSDKEKKDFLKKIFPILQNALEENTFNWVSQKDKI